MSIENPIHQIITQLIDVTDYDLNNIREKTIENLTPVKWVSEGPSPPTDPEYSFYVTKQTPKGSSFSRDDALTVVVSKELYPSYLELPPKEFTVRFNKTILDHISASLKEERERNVPDTENIWIQPNAAFLNWFHENGIDTDAIEALSIEQQTGMSDTMEDSSSALWAIADDMRERKDEGEFPTYRAAYRWAESNLTHHSKPIKASRLEKAYHKAKSEGKVD